MRIVTFIVQVIRMAGLSPRALPPAGGPRVRPAPALYRRRISSAWNQALASGVGPAAWSAGRRRNGPQRG